jgi:hypothetical protein
MATLHARCTSMLAQWDERWSQPGCDGITIGGMFDSASSESRLFVLWSPEKRCAAHAMLSAALDCFPFDRCSGVTEELLEIVRSYLELQPPVTITNEDPVRLRLAPWVHGNDAYEIETSLRALPEDTDLIIDVSAVERLGRAMLSILPMAQLLNRRGGLRWIAQSVDTNALIAQGVDPSTIEIVQRAPISPTGDPVVLGGIEVSSAELIALAKEGTRIALVRALRQEYGLTISQASMAAGELLDILAVNPIS